MQNFVLLSSLLPLVSAFCAHGTSLMPRSSDKIKVAEFDYDTLAGPLNWFSLDAEANALCSLGTEQSPINIITATAKAINGSQLAFGIQDYPDGAEFENLGSTVEVIAEGTLIRDSKQYSLKQFHVHTPSEHRIDGEYYPMEIHFVFEAHDKSISVVGFPVEIAQQGDDLLRHAFEHVDEIETPGTVTETGPLFFDYLENHLRHSTVYQYSGSLTTPPCSESIAWNVVKDPIYVDVETYLHVKKVVKFNSRYTQNKSGQINLLENSRIKLEGN